LTTEFDLDTVKMYHRAKHLSFR